MEVEGGRDKIPLIKAMSAEPGLVQNLNQTIIQPLRKKGDGGDYGVFVCVVAVK